MESKNKAGRPKSKEPKKAILFRAPASKVEEVKNLVYGFLNNEQPIKPQTPVKAPIKAAKAAISPAIVQPEAIQANDKPLNNDMEQEIKAVTDNKHMAPLQK